MSCGAGLLRAEASAAALVSAHYYYSTDSSARLHSTRTVRALIVVRSRLGPARPGSHAPTRAFPALSRLASIRLLCACSAFPLPYQYCKLHCTLYNVQYTRCIHTHTHARQQLVIRGAASASRVRIHAHNTLECLRFLMAFCSACVLNLIRVLCQFEIDLPPNGFAL